MLPSSTFYGKSKTIEEKDEIETEVQVFKRIPKIEYSLLQPSSKRSTFSKQAAAIEYRRHDKSQTIFSWEYSTGGVRQFLVTSPQSFWDFYSTEERRHYYEVISENSPCKLYLDLEFKIEDNPILVGEDIVDNLINQLITFASQKIEINISKDEILVLDSTSQTKFSNHLIFTSLVFADNFQAGRFIDDFLSSLSKDQIQTFKVKKGDDYIWIIDTGVYTKNRNFRLYLSSKYGRKEILDISTNDLFSIKLLEENYTDPKFDREKIIFMNSLVSLTTDLPSYDYSSNQIIHNKLKEKRPRMTLKKCTSLIEGEKQSSPYTEIDQLIKDLVAPTGFIRKWKISEDSATVTYEIGGNRFCRNINREHKSNNIKYICDLDSGVINQRCHDPECREYRGPDIKLPENLFPWSDWEQSDMLLENKTS